MLVKKGVIHNQFEFVDLRRFWGRKGLVFHKRRDEIAASLGGFETVWANYRCGFAVHNIVKLIAVMAVRLLDMSGRSRRTIDPHQVYVAHFIPTFLTCGKLTNICLTILSKTRTYSLWVKSECEMKNKKRNRTGINGLILRWSFVENISCPTLKRKIAEKTSKDSPIRPHWL